MPMNGNYLLDTNIIIGLFAQEPAILQKLATNVEVCTTSINIGELYYGAYNSGRVLANELRIDEFCLKINALTPDAENS